MKKRSRTEQSVRTRSIEPSRSSRRISFDPKASKKFLAPFGMAAFLPDSEYCHGSCTAFGTCSYGGPSGRNICGRLTPFRRTCEKSYSLAFWKDPAVAEDEALFHRAVVEGIITYLDAYFRNLYFCKSTPLEALLTDELEKVWQLDALEIVTDLKRTVLNSPQCCW